MLSDLKEDLARIRREIESATKDNETYSGGLIKSLMGVRLEVLKTNEVLVDQRIHALEAGIQATLVVNVANTDPVRAAELANEIERQKTRVTEARAEADRYSGGLVHAMAETAVATGQNSLAMLEQQYLIAKYGLAMPAAPPRRPASDERESKSEASSSLETPAARSPSSVDVGDCLRIETFDSSILDTNDSFTELSWKVDIVNSCESAISVRVSFTLYDVDEFKLDSDFEDVYVPAKGTGKARGTMLISPPEKARRMARQGVSLSLP